MKDELISFETAKLAKEKGFNRKTQFCYDEKGRKCYIGAYVVESLSDLTGKARYNSYQAPTQSLLQRWLREVHGIYVTANPSNIKIDKKCACVWRGYINYHTIKCLDYVPDGKIAVTSSDKTYEQALEAGLQEALKLIKS
jgi:hypothetical protein